MREAALDELKFLLEGLERAEDKVLKKIGDAERNVLKPLQARLAELQDKQEALRFAIASVYKATEET